MASSAIDKANGLDDLPNHRPCWIENFGDGQSSNHLAKGPGHLPNRRSQWMENFNCSRTRNYFGVPFLACGKGRASSAIAKPDGKGLEFFYRYVPNPPALRKVHLNVLEKPQCRKGKIADYFECSRNAYRTRTLEGCLGATESCGGD